jgi:hypothetical protein
MHIGEIIEICFHKNNIVIPSGFLSCDGRLITEEEYPELFFHLSNGNDEGEVFLPAIEDYIINNDLIIRKVIAYKEETKCNVKYDGEFTINNLPNRVFNRRDICAMRQQGK